MLGFVRIGGDAYGFLARHSELEMSDRPRCDNYDEIFFELSNQFIAKGAKHERPTYPLLPFCLA